MTALQAGVRSGAHRVARAEVLGDESLTPLRALLDEDPIVNAVLASRLARAHTLRRAALGGTMLGVRTGSVLRAGCFNGGNLVPVGGGPADWAVLGDAVAQRQRICTSLVGPASAVLAMWERLEPVWGPARAVRERQPLLVFDSARDAEDAAGDVLGLSGEAAVRPARPADLDRYVAASAAMFTEELGISPYAAGGSPRGYQARVLELIRRGRAMASFDFRGQVVFKADLGTVTRDTCQIQGVWVRPDLRGRGIGTAGLITVIRYALTLAPTVSLYVNEFNHPARRVYAKLGMREHATLATVLL